MERYGNQNLNEYLLNSSFLAEKNLRVLKCDETFGIFDRYGDIVNQRDGEQGLYYEGTRFLSKCELLINGYKPLLLSSFITDDNAALVVELTNPELESEKIPSGVLHITRTIFLWHNAQNELLKVSSYIDRSVKLPIRYEFSADYRDIFEIRGHHRTSHGDILAPRFIGDSVRLGYQGLDGLKRYTSVFSKPVDVVRKDAIEFSLNIPARGSKSGEIKFVLGMGEQKQLAFGSFSDEYRKSREEVAKRRKFDASINTSNEQFNDLINRSLADIHLLITSTKWGPYPYAGVPWFSAPFGRDGIITALEMLWVNPNLARAVLHYLSETQGEEIDEENDCEPGKIIHEVRQGEMANLGEIPFKRYYGSVDSTLLFIILAGAYFSRSGDLEFIKEIWPNVQAALCWAEEYGDCDADGFVEYYRHSTKGIVHQGWKDSENSVFHSTGELAKAPIALCEVQGYLYLALKHAAHIASAVGEVELAERLRKKRARLREKFHEKFWLKDVRYFALALDKDKKPCRVKSSNVGHCLFTGIVNKSEAKNVADLLMSPEFFSGWGVRTIGENEALYNPMSYHNGTIWPHDNAIIGAGLARYGYKDYCINILTGLFDASNLLDFHRLPELFCGFSRSPGRNPTIYPMSCAPQAWSAGSIFLLLGACLGIVVEVPTHEVFFYHPKLPSYLEYVKVRNFRIDSQTSIDLEFVNHGEDVGINILRRDGRVKVIVVK